MKIGVYELVSDVHNESCIDRTVEDFLIPIKESLEGVAWSKVDINELDLVDLPIIFVKSGGVEGKFRQVYEQLPEPYILLASNRHNSLAASLEVLSFAQKQGKQAEILHGSTDYIVERLQTISRMMEVRKRLSFTKLGVIGKPSDWLIASNADYSAVKETLGIELIDIAMDELVAEIEKAETIAPIDTSIIEEQFGSAVTGTAMKIYNALKAIVAKYQLSGLTLRCFDLLDMYKNTGCVALSLLNDEGIIAGCEGDVPGLISMVVLNYLTGEPVFIANPSSIDSHANTMIVAHCTVPMSMTNEVKFETHFESGLGIGIRGTIAEGACTMFKLSGDCKCFFVSQAEIFRNLTDENLCRTQLELALSQDVQYFLRQPIGNHHIICKGDYSRLVAEFFEWLY